MHQRADEKRADPKRPFQIAAGFAASLTFILLTTAPLLLRYRSARTPHTWPRAPVWQGNGVLQAANGSTFPLYVKLRFERKHGGAGPTDGKTNLIGTASLCTVQKSPLDLDISGSLDAWWLENGKAVTLYLRTERNSSPRLSFLLYGSWQGTELVLEDRGTLAYFFNAGTDMKNWQRPPAKVKNAQITLRYGEKDEFEALCPSPT